MKEHGDLILAEIHQLMEYASADRKGDGRTPKDIPSKAYEPLFTSIEAFIRHATRPDKGELARQRETYDMIKDIHANVTIIKAQSRAPAAYMNAKTASSTLSWAQIASRDALPPSIQNQISSGTTTAPIENAKQKEVVIRSTGNKPTPKTLHALTPAELIKALNSALQRSPVPQVNKARFTAARINARGSIVAYTETAREAEILRHNRDYWKGEVAGGLEVVVPTFPVLLHGIPIKSWDMGNKKEMTELLRFENKQVLGNHRLVDARWLKKYKEYQRDGSLIIDCETPEGANAIVKAGTLAWHHGLRPTKKCDPTCQFLRCLKCYRYGKCKGTYCTNNETCGKCASKEHNTGDCKATEKKCCLCGGQHYAWSQQCPDYKKEVQRVQIAKDRLELNPWYPEAARHINPGPAVTNSSVSPQADSNITENGREPKDAIMVMDGPTDPQPTESTKRRQIRQPLKEVNANVTTRAKIRATRSKSPNERGQGNYRTRSKSRPRRDSDITVYEDARGRNDSDNEDTCPARNTRSSQGIPKKTNTAKPTSRTTANSLN